MKVIGLDLSLRSTGIACSLGCWVDRYQPHLTGLKRLRAIRDWARDMTRGADLVVVEGLAVSSQSGHHLERAGLWYLVVEDIDRRGILWAEMAPATVKKYATGRGNAGKDEVLAAVIRRFPGFDVAGNDEADALVLCAAGMDAAGEPIAEMPAVNRAALASVRWPAFTQGDAP